VEEQGTATQEIPRNVQQLSSNVTDEQPGASESESASS
jgi:hypothetical protein